MTMKNNYGAWIDSEVPSPGVISANEINWECLDEGICLDCLAIEKEIRECDTCPECGGDLLQLAPDYIECEECGEEYDMDGEFEMMECSDHTHLYGDWKKDEKGLYIPDKEGEFAAIFIQGSFNDFTVVWSKFTTRGTPCSPCAPSCISIPDEKEGEFLCYTLPDYLIEKDE